MAASPADDWNADFLDLVDALIAPENARRVVEALRSFGAPLASVGVSEADFASPGQTYQMGIKPRRIDILTELSGVTFDDAWKDRLTREIFGRQVPFIGVAALRKNKIASGRPKDLADAAWLDTTYPGHLPQG